MLCIKSYIPAGKAGAIPLIGPILGQYRLNLIEFCKDFNEQTNSFNDSLILPISIMIFDDGEFDYYVKMPTTSFFFKRIVGNEYFSKLAGKSYIGIITIQQLYELIHIKWLNHTNDISKFNYISILIGSANSSGIYCTH